MSRDAKVGLVIVFAFVFLLGTIMVHRMKGSAADSPALAEVDVDDGTPIGDSGDSSPMDASAGQAGSILSATTVDAVPTNDLDVPPAGNAFRPSNSVFSETVRPNNPFGAPREPRVPADSARPPDSGGGHISLNEPDGERQPAAVVERQNRNANAVGDDPVETERARPSAFETPPRRSETSSRPQPLLELRNRPAELPSDEANADSGSLTTTQPEREQDSTATTKGEVGSAAREMLDKFAGRTIPQLDTPPSSDTPPESDEIDSRPAPIQQAVGDQRPDSRDATPPKLPKFGNPPEPTIEAVPDRGTPRGSIGERRTVPPVQDLPNPRSARAGAAEPDPVPARTSGERTYTVKEGDSFWSISAKQYGTGKHFRALEEYNRDRLKSDGTLKAGSVIALPDVSLLKMRSSPKASIPAGRESPTASARNDTPPPDNDARNAARPVDSGRSTPSASPTAPRSGGSAKPSVYVVEDGDTLSTIALRKLGSSKRWDEIYRMNQERIPDPNRLKVGTELKLPVAATENPADRVRTGR